MTDLISHTRRSLLLAAAASLAGCNGTLPFAASGPAAEAPTYRPGDRWVYHATDGFMVPVVWEETHEITGIDAGGIAVRVTQRGPSVDNVRMEQWAAPGLVKVGTLFDEETRRFEQLLKRYDFPLKPGKVWNQRLRNYNEQTKRTGEINRYVSVGGWRTIATPAGSFDAVALNVYMHLDDQEFWREQTDCVYRLWYAPAVGAAVREEKEAQYFERSGKLDTGPIRSQHALLELTAYAPAGR